MRNVNKNGRTVNCTIQILKFENKILLKRNKKKDLRRHSYATCRHYKPNLAINIIIF